MKNDATLETFRVEYEKVYEALKLCADREQLLAKKCEELNAEVADNAVKVQTAMKLSQDDQSTILSLKKELEKSWKTIDSYHEKQASTEGRVEELTHEIEGLSNVIEQENETQLEMKANYNEIIKERDEVVAKLARKDDHLTDVNARCEELVHELNSYQAQEKQLMSRLADSERKVETTTNDLQREIRRKERLNEEIRTARKALEHKTVEERTLIQEINKLNETVAKAQTKVKDESGVNEKLSRDYELLFQKTQKLCEDLEVKDGKIHDLAMEKQTFETEAKEAKASGSKLEADNKLVTRKLDREKKRVLFHQQQLEESKRAVVTLENQVKQLSREVLIHSKTETSLTQKIEELKRENNVICKTVTKEVTKTTEALTHSKVQQRKNKNLEGEIKVLHTESLHQLKAIRAIEKQREQFNVEANDAKEKYFKCAEDVKVKQSQALNQQKQAFELELKLKHQQQLYEQARADRNLYSKRYLEEKDQLAEEKRRIKVSSHQIEQLKEEIIAKDRALVKEHFEFRQVQKNEDNLKIELSRTKVLTEDSDKVVKTQNTEIVNLSKMIRTLDEDIVQHKKAYGAAINERDVLSAHLIRRNDEILLLSEKVNLLESTLKIGNLQYNERIEEIERLGRELQQIDREFGVTKEQNGKIKGLVGKVEQLTKQLRQEKMKVSALSEELENPVNIHRFRFLETTNPGMVDLIQKINTLQKRLIAKNEQVMQKEMLLEEKERQVGELQKDSLENRSGTKLEAKLSQTQRALGEKTSRLKATLAELNFQEKQLGEYHIENEQLAGEVHRLKNLLIKLKQQHQGEEKTID